jgi:hypothetical protein
MSFERHVYAVQQYTKATQPRYSQLFKPLVPTHPICCFGEPAKAVVVTVGVNPSVGELENGSWPCDEMPPNALADRCRNYFSAATAAAQHRFFKPWKQALTCLGTSYEAGSAVHLDLSPRATRYIRKLDPGFENELFLEMVRRDLWVFFATLALCRNVKLLLVAGSVTKRHYINEFLQRFAPDYGHALGGAFVRAKSKGRGKTCWHEVDPAERKLPAFFCSSGPAANNSSLLGQRVCENAPALKRILEA